MGIAPVASEGGKVKREGGEIGTSETRRGGIGTSETRRGGEIARDT